MIRELAIAVMLLALGYLFLGVGGIILALVASLLRYVWRIDNWTGSCFMLTILFVLVVGILLLLVSLMALRPTM